MTYLISYIIFKTILKVFFKFTIKGKENIPRKGPFIIASNHISYADPAVVGVTCNTMPVMFMAKKDLFSAPFFGWWFKALGCIPVERKSGNFTSLKKAVQRLREGKVLGIFPEGTRSFDGCLQKAEPGIGLIAAKSGVPIVPVYVSGTEKALPKGKRMPRPCRVKARVGKTVDISESVKISDRKKRYESVGEKVMDAIFKLKDE